jgi:thiaminase/transcriptional activator TenA
LLVRAAGELWGAATSSPFLDGAQDGSLPREAFERWLVQDYHFAVALTAFEGVLVSRSCRPAQSTIISGLAAMDAELAWFEEHSGRRKLDLQAPIHPVCQRYRDFLLRAAHGESVAGLYAVLYGVELSYFAAWSALRPEGPHAEFIERWSNPAFRDYVVKLRGLAEDASDASSQPLFNEVLRHERDFWAMTWSG